MRARLREIRLRDDIFGGICYVPHRDDFFAADKKVFSFLKNLSSEWREITEVERSAISALARLGICETVDPEVLEQPYSGPSFLGQFLELPTVSMPLVVNCFCTAHCPLSCVYCHADDLMKEFRPIETETDLENVAATANMVPAMVAVITGGDPLTRPERAKRLIERLASQKALVLDTSGVGDIEILIPTLKAHRVHVRVSLDAISDENRKSRPPNRQYVSGQDASFQGAKGTIERCVEEKIPITVQTVVSARNENDNEWRDLRDWLIDRGVRNWVIHVAVKGGNARKIEEIARLKKRPRGILPGPGVYPKLWRLVSETQKEKLPIDIRCTDTDTTPNSVLLVGSKGDLYTEGYAHNGKVALYNVDKARPDLTLWPHLDRFGHARRYLNWNPWFFNGESLEKICYEIDAPNQVSDHISANPVETETKYQVRDVSALRALISNLGYDAVGEPTWQRDEYFDTEEKLCERLDYVVRVRKEDRSLMIALKGPRSWVAGKEYSRIELEVPAGHERKVRDALLNRGFEITWFFEKKRDTFRHANETVLIALDEVPEIGYFVEIEGSLQKVRSLETQLATALGEQETRNYAELYRAFKIQQGVNPERIKGASFGTISRRKR